MKKKLQKILYFGVGLVPGGNILQAREINNLQNKKNEVYGNLERLGGSDNKIHKGDNGAYKISSILNKATNVYSEVVGLTFMGLGYSEFMKGNIKMGVTGLIFYGTVKGLANLENMKTIELEKNILKSSQKRLEEKAEEYKNDFGRGK